MLHHVRAEEVTVCQCTQRRHQSDEKCNQRGGKTDRTTTASEGKEISNQGERTNQKKRGIPFPGCSKKLMCGHRGCFRFVVSVAVASAKGAVSPLTWGNAPGIRFNQVQALKARFNLRNIRM